MNDRLCFDGMTKFIRCELYELPGSLLQLVEHRVRFGRLSIFELRTVFGRGGRQQKADGVGCCQEGRRITCSEPVEFVLPAGLPATDAASPTGDCRLNPFLLTRSDIQEPAAKWGTQPLVATGSVEVAVELSEIEWEHSHGVRAVDADGDAEFFGTPANLLDGHDHGRW